MPRDRIHRIGAILVGATLAVAAPALSQELYFNDFDGGETFGAGVAGGLSGETAVEPVQGYAGLGPAGGEFAGNLLRNTTVPGAPTVLTLTGLPPHDAISLEFLFAAIDSWDGIFAVDAEDLFAVTLDGETIFLESFLNSTAPTTQSYAGPALSFRQDLGFTAGGVDFFDSAYDLAENFVRMPHTADTLTLEFFADGAHWQGGTDESWGMDNLIVSVPEPALFAQLLVGGAVLGLCRRRRV